MVLVWIRIACYTLGCGVLFIVCLGLPAEIQTARALAVISSVIWAIMIPFTVFGMTCVNWKSESPNKVFDQIFIYCIIALARYHQKCQFGGNSCYV